MPLEPAPSAPGETARPLAIRFADLFDHLGTADLSYSAAARDLSGREVVIEGYLSHTHGPHHALSLVDQPGVCPDCAPVPAAVIALPGAHTLHHGHGNALIRVMGRLDYGFRIDGDFASMLRIEGAKLQRLTGQS
jgi:hypothetical protein